MIIADVKEGNVFCAADELWQYDYGQILRIQGINLQTAVEIHFSLNDTGGESVTRIGVTKDGVTDVVIPDSMLENNGAASNYYIYVFVYLADAESGQTVRKIKMRVKSRPKPEAFGPPENAELFREAIAVVNESANRAEDAEKRAEEYAAQTAEDAQTAESNRQSIENTAAQVALDRDAVSQDRQAVEELKNQTQTSASEALLSKQRANESENAASESRAGAEAAENAAAQHELTAEQYKNYSEAAKEAVVQIGQQAVTDVQNAGQEQINRVAETGNEAVRNVSVEGDKQVKAVQDTAVEIADNLEHITIRCAAAGKTITVSDSLNMPLKGMKIYGHSTQQTTGDNQSPSPEHPQPIISAGDKGSIEITITDGADSTQIFTYATPNGLPGIPVEKGGNYTDETGQQWIADYRDWERGVDVKAITKITYDGTERWTYHNNTYFAFILAVTGIDYSVVPMCDRYKCGLNAGNIRNEQLRISAGIKGILIKDDAFSGSEIRWKQNLSQNPLTVLFAMETPVETPISAEELAAYRALHTNTPMTTITNDSECWMEAEYIANTQKYINDNYVQKTAYEDLAQRVSTIEAQIVNNI